MFFRRKCMPVFKHYDLRLLNPRFDSELIDVLEKLGHLRHHKFNGSTPDFWFFQLKNIFHILESLGSARIEGNHTTLADYIESKLDSPQQKQGEGIREIVNIERAMGYLEEHIGGDRNINELLIRELHAMTVKELSREGDESPGAYRKKQVYISRSDHIPPDPIQVPGYMQEFMAFINNPDPLKYDLMKIALAHHRFTWVHPFNNGNGRVVRLLTYAMLLKYKFNVNTEGSRLLNPTAIFCNDRDMYYLMLSRGDVGTDEGLEAWCIYVLKGIYEEVSKIDRLGQYEYVANKILSPAIAYAKARELITANEWDLLNFSIREKFFKTGDLDEIFPNLTSRQKTYFVKKLLDRKMLRPIAQGVRTYTINFSESYLLRGVIKVLADEGFISEKLIKP